MKNIDIPGNVGESQSAGGSSEWDSLTELASENTEDLAENSEPVVDDIANENTEDLAENDEPTVDDIAEQGWAKMTGYYKKNPDKIHELVREYLANDNGAEVPEGVAENAQNGWAKMTGYYKKNPDKVHELVQAYLANAAIAKEMAEQAAEGVETVEEPKTIEQQPETIEEPKTFEGPKVVEEPRAIEEQPEAIEEQPEVVNEVKPVEEPKAIEQQPEVAEEPKAVEQQPEIVAEADKKAENVSENADVNSNENENVDLFEGFGKFGETRFRREAKRDSDLINTDKYFVYLPNQQAKEAIPYDNLMSFIENKADNINSPSDLNELKGLFLAIDSKHSADERRLAEIAAAENGQDSSGESSDGALAEEKAGLEKRKEDFENILKKINEIKNSRDFQLKSLTADLAQQKKRLEYEKGNLERAKDAYNALKNVSFINRLLNFRERNTAKQRIDWTQHGIDNIEGDIVKLEAKIDELKSEDDSGAKIVNMPKPEDSAEKAA